MTKIKNKSSSEAEFIDIKSNSKKFKVFGLITLFTIILIFTLFLMIKFNFITFKETIITEPDSVNSIQKKELNIENILKPESRSDSSISNKLEIEKKDLRNSKSLNNLIEESQILEFTSEQIILNQTIKDFMREKRDSELKNQRNLLRIISIIDFKKDFEDKNSKALKIESILKLFPNKNEIRNKVLKISSIEHRDTSYFLNELNNLINGEVFFNSNDYNINYSDNIDESNTTFIKKLKDYFIRVIDSNIRIKKVNDSSSLYDYSDHDNDGLPEYKNKIITARNHLIQMNIDSALEEIDKIESPIGYDLENLRDELAEQSEFKKSLIELEDLIIKTVMEEIKIDKNF